MATKIDGLSITITPREPGANPEPEPSTFSAVNLGRTFTVDPRLAAIADRIDPYIMREAQREIAAQLAGVPYVPEPRSVPSRRVSPPALPSPTMGGKPSKGTPADKRLSDNRRPKPKPKPSRR